MAADRPRINAAALMAMALWGGASVGGKLALTGFDSIALTGFRLLLAVPILFLALPAPERKALMLPIPRRWLLLLAALSSTGGQFCWALGLQFVPASHSILIYATSPIWAAIFAAVLGQDRLQRHIVAGVVVAFVGVVLIVGPALGAGGGMFLGYVLTFVAAFALAITSVLIAQVVRYYGALACSAAMALLCAILSLPPTVLSASHLSWGTIGVESWIGLGYTAIGAYVVGTVLWYRGIHQIGSTQAMVYAYLQPIFGVALAAALLGERLTPVQFGGAAVVLIGVAFAQGRFAHLGVFLPGHQSGAGNSSLARRRATMSPGNIGAEAVRLGRIVAVSAHPDDETLFAGGILARYAAEGHEVSILCVTRGEGGEVGEPPVGPKERLGELREAEMRCSARALGVRDVIFLGFVDPPTEIGGELRPIDASLEEFAGAIAEQLGRLRPDVVLTHGSNGEYGHPQHVYTHKAVWEALRRLAPWRPAELLTWCANYEDNRDDRITNQDDPADIVLYVEPWLAAKAAAADCHRSQHAMIQRNTGKDLRAALRRVESFRRWPLEGSEVEEAATWANRS